MREQRISRRKFIRRLIFYTILVLVVSAVLVYIFVWGNFGILRIRELESEKTEIEEEIETVKSENEELEEIVEDESELEEMIEKEKREEMGFLKDDEVLFKFVEPDDEE